MPLATLDEVASLEGLAMTQVTSEPLKAGAPVFVGVSGTLYLSAAAAGLSRGLVDGFARTDTATGQPCQIEDRHLTLDDWTQVTGTTSLVPGTRYFLDLGFGKLTAVAPSGAGVSVIRVGVALNAHTLRIQIVDLTGISASGGTPAPGPITAAPTAPATTASSITLAWAAPTTGGAPTDYLVQYKLSSASIWTTVDEASTALGATVAGLTAATSYDFRVQATNSAGQGAASPVLTVSTTAAPVSGGTAGQADFSDPNNSGLAGAL